MLDELLGRALVNISGTVKDSMAFIAKVAVTFLQHRYKFLKWFSALNDSDMNKKSSSIIGRSVV